MNGAEFVRLVRRLGKARGVVVRLDESHGKGSHGRLHYGGAFCTVKDRNKELGAGLLGAMLRQLGLTKADIGQ